MAKPKVKLTCETRIDISSPEIAQRLLAPFFFEAKLAPNKVAYAEPIKHEFNGLDDLIAIWWAKTKDEDGCEASPSDYGTNYHPIFLKRSKAPTHWIGVNFSFFTALNSVMPARISLEAQWIPTIDYEKILQIWCDAVRADFGMLHVFTDTEVQGFKALGDSFGDEERRDDLDRSLGFFRSGLFMSPVWQKLQNLGWAQFFGEEQLKRLDLSAIESAGFKTRRHARGEMVYVSSDFCDVVDDFEEFSDRRSALKSLFPKDYFHITAEPLVT